MENPDVVARARKGDRGAFGEIVEVFQAPIVRYLYRLTGEIELARDLGQDTFVQAFEGLARTTQDLPFKTWLYRIATNNALQHRRRRKLLSFVPLGDEGQQNNLKYEQDLSGTAAVQEALLKVPPKLRVCMVLHMVDGFRYREIAETLGISIDAVRMRVARGSVEFRKHYGGGDESEVQ